MDILDLNYSLLTTSLWGNSLWQLLWAVIIFVVLVFVFKMIQAILVSKFTAVAEKTPSDLDDTLIKIITTIRPPFYVFVALFLAIQLLSLNAFSQQILNIIFITWIVWQIIQISEILIDYVTLRKLKIEDENDARSAAQALSLIAKIFLWSFGLLLILSNIGLDITSLLAGLGIGGIAVAFAVKDILTDLFSSFTIYLDKPFRVGDFIVVGQQTGTVQKIGIKTTRIKSLQGEEIVIPNQKLSSELIQNYKRMEQRRVSSTLGIAYKTPPQKLKEIPGWIKEIIEAESQVEFKRAHLKQFNEFAIMYEYVYVISESNYDLFMDINQTVHFKILEKLIKEKVNLAYPLLTVPMNKS